MPAKDSTKAPKGQVSAALDLARAGIPIFPVDAKKHPLVKWKDAATTDESQIRKWWNRWPEAMPAFPTGEPSGIAVLDLDRKDGKDGVEALRHLGFEAESAFVVETASGGLHLWFKHTPGLRCSVGQDKDGLAGVDVRGERGFAVAPGAKGYTFTSGDLDLWADLRDVGCLPMWPEEMPMQPRAIRASSGAEPSGLSFDALRSALLSLSLEDRERLFGSDAEWFKVCRIIVDETGGSEEGNALWHEWSVGWGGYDHHEAESKWCREDAYTGERASVWAILRPAVDAGWTHPDFEAWQAATAAEDFDGPDADEEAELDALVGTPSKALTQVEWGTPLMRGDKPVINLFNTTVYLGRNLDSILPGLAHNLMNGRDEWRDGQLTDSAVALARMALERRGLETVGKELVADAAHAVARKRAYHPIRDQLNAVAWDGTGRLELVAGAVCGGRRHALCPHRGAEVHDCDGGARHESGMQARPHARPVRAARPEQEHGLPRLGGGRVFQRHAAVHPWRQDRRNPPPARQVAGGAGRAGTVPEE